MDRQKECDGNTICCTPTNLFLPCTQDVKHSTKFVTIFGCFTVFIYWNIWNSEKLEVRF